MSGQGAVSRGPVTFFYPSTEWELDQPFECRCGSPVSDAIPDSYELAVTEAAELPAVCQRGERHRTEAGARERVCQSLDH